MKTKFDQIVKLKKLDVEKIERELLKQNQKIEKANQELTQFKIEFSKFEYPKTGNFALITQFKTMQTAFLREIKQKEEELVFLENQKILLFRDLYLAILFQNTVFLYLQLLLSYVEYNHL